MTSVTGELHWAQQAGSKPGAIVRPTTLEDAARQLAENPQLRPVAGGTDLLLELARDRQNRQVDLLDTTGIDGFKNIAITPDGVVLGAGVTHADVVGSEMLGDDVSHVLRQACLEIGSPQLRNRATIVGNVVTASPANDTISALMALDAQLRVVRMVDGQLTERSIGLDDFYTGFRSTALEPGELITEVVLPTSSHQRRGIWVKAGLRKAQAISVVHAGIVLYFDGQGVVVDARIALGSVGPTVVLSHAAAEVLIGAELDPAAIATASELAAQNVQPIDDGRATAEYRLHAVSTVVGRALRAIAAGAERSQWPERVPLLSTPVTNGGSTSAPGARSIGAGDPVSVSVNGTTLSAAPTGAGTLLDWLRETAGTGTKEGCAEGECGACTVQMNGDAVMSCLVPAGQADGSAVTTIEGLAPADVPNVMQQLFVDRFAVQCGYCIPGFVVAAQTLAEEFDRVPTRQEIELALSGNLCRCTGYYNIIDAVAAAIEVEQS